MNPTNDDSEITRILQRLESAERQAAWSQFLTGYSPLIYQVIQLFEREPDLAGDCFVFICEKLCQDRFRRLRHFKPEGAARFSTWLRVVARNLCLDWRRKEFGRQQIFESIARLTPFDQEVFRSVYHHNLSKEDCYFHLLGRHPGLKPDQIEDSLNRIQQALTPRQLWLLQAGRPRVAPLENENDIETEAPSQQIADPAPDPETFTAMKEQQAALDQALGRLEASERLLLKLRFDQDLTLLEIARLTDLKDAQTADRRIREILEKLRKQMNLPAPGRGKTGKASV